MSPFNPDDFMGQTVDAPMSTELSLVPEGEYKAMIGDFDSEKAFRTFESPKRPGQDFTVFTPPFAIQDDAVEADLGRKPVVFHKGMFLDFNDAGGLDTSKGRNVDLGRLREAVGQNTSPWTFNMLKGAGPVMVKVVHETDKNDSSKKYARVTRVVKIS